MEYKDCFAYIDEKICNALIEKNCINCKFYKTNNEVDNITKNLIKKEIEKINN